MHLTSWGKYPTVTTMLKTPRSEATALAWFSGRSSTIGRGLGRSYGDSALNGQTVTSSLRLDAMKSFDPETGLLVAEAGVSLADILDSFTPRGWFLPVTPGTKFVTLGGAVACDVHGKDHHVEGSFCRHVEWLDIWTPALGILRCSPLENSDIFFATAGGMGLTGFILHVAIKLKRIPSAFISQKTVKADSLSEIMETFEENASLPFSVAWIDCLKSGASQGRSIFMGGHFAQPGELPAKRQNQPFLSPCSRKLAVPFNFPSFALNSLSVKAFNALYYAKAPKGISENVVSYNTFFYPLDAIHDWNRIYGRRGFTQYQFVIPKENAAEGLPKILSAIANSAQGSFLAVLKLFGEQPEFEGNLSFPMKGYTLALDFAITNKLFPLLDRLDAMVLDYGGRHYLTKDCRLSSATFCKSYGQVVEEFQKVKFRLDPKGMFCSLQSMRLGLSR